MFVPKRNIYVGENNLIKELNEQNKKGYFVNDHSFKTKLYVLNCNKMITNKKHNNLPFGKSNYKYMQAGQFDVITRE